MSDFYTLDNESTPPSYPTTKIGQTLDVNALLSDKMAALHRAEKAEAAIKRVRELHQEQLDYEWLSHDCTGCDHEWPCPTIKALDVDQ